MATLSNDLEDNVEREPSTNELEVAAVPRAVHQRSAKGALAMHEPRTAILPAADEVFRGIYTRAGIGMNGEFVGVCSAIAGEGKTTVGLGLAVTMAQDFPTRSVLLVEADLERPVLARDFDVEPRPGLAECLLNASSLEEAVRPTYLENLDLLPAGGPSEGMGRLLRSVRMGSAADAWRQMYEIVIVDLPAILVNSDSLVVSDLLDVLIFVARAGVTPTSLVTKALEQLDASKVRGVVLNDSTTSTPNWLRRMCGY